MQNVVQNVDYNVDDELDNNEVDRNRDVAVPHEDMVPIGEVKET